VFFGLSAGMNFTNAMYECNKYLVGKKMYVNGLILVGTGSGSVIFGLFTYNYLNPMDIQPFKWLLCRKLSFITNCRQYTKFTKMALINLFVHWIFRCFNDSTYMLVKSKKINLTSKR
jgi:hypothetical protein